MKVFALKMGSWSIVSGDVGADLAAHWASWVWWVSVVLYSPAVVAKPEAAAPGEQKQDL